MAGRHNWNALASGLDLMGSLMAQRAEEERKRKEYAAALEQKLKYEILVEEVKKGRLGLDPVTGKLVPRTPPAPQIPSNLEPSGFDYEDASGIKHQYARPMQAAADSSLSANEQDLMSSQMSPGMPYSGAIPSMRTGAGQQFKDWMQRKINTPIETSPGIHLPMSESPAVEISPNQPMQPVITSGKNRVSAPAVSGTARVTGQDENDPIIKTGTDQATGKRVGLTKSGKIVPLQ